MPAGRGVGADQTRVRQVLETAGQLGGLQVGAVGQGPGPPRGLRAAVGGAQPEGEPGRGLGGVVEHAVVDVVGDAGRAEHVPEGVAHGLRLPLRRGGSRRGDAALGQLHVRPCLGVGREGLAQPAHEMAERAVGHVRRVIGPEHGAAQVARVGVHGHPPVPGSGAGGQAAQHGHAGQDGLRRGGCVQCAAEGVVERQIGAGGGLFGADAVVGRVVEGGDLVEPRGGVARSAVAAADVEPRVGVDLVADDEVGDPAVTVQSVVPLGEHAGEAGVVARAVGDAEDLHARCGGYARPAGPGPGRCPVDDAGDDETALGPGADVLVQARGHGEALAVVLLLAGGAGRGLHGGLPLRPHQVHGDAAGVVARDLVLVRPVVGLDGLDPVVAALGVRERRHRGMRLGRGRPAARGEQQDERAQDGRPGPPGVCPTSHRGLLAVRRPVGVGQVQ